MIKKMSRLLEIKVFEPLMYAFKTSFSSEEAYFKTIMRLRSIIRGISRNSLTASANHQSSRANFYLDKLSLNNRVLEVGCGQLGIGVFLIDALAKGSYVGVDISKPVIKTALKIINANDHLKSKEPLITITASADQVAKVAIENNCDTFVFNSVFTHMSMKLISEYLVSLGEVDTAMPRVLCDISVPKDGISIGINGIDYYYSINDFVTLCNVAGWKCSYKKDEISTDKYTTYLFDLHKSLVN